MVEIGINLLCAVFFLGVACTVALLFMLIMSKILDWIHR